MLALIQASLRLPDCWQVCLSLLIRDQTAEESFGIADSGRGGSGSYDGSETLAHLLSGPWPRRLGRCSACARTAARRAGWADGEQPWPGALPAGRAASACSPTATSGAQIFHSGLCLRPGRAAPRGTSSVLARYPHSLAPALDAELMSTLLITSILSIQGCIVLCIVVGEQPWICLLSSAKR